MLTINLDTFPHLETSRLALRQVQVEDAERLFQIRNHPDVIRYLDRDADKDVSQVRELILRMENNYRSGNVFWAISLRGSDALIGGICFWQMDYQNHRGEVGFLLDPEHWCRGLMHEALTAATAFGFHKMKLHSVLANTSVHNSACQRLLLKAVLCKRPFRENHFFNGQFLDSLIFCKITDLK